MTFRQHINPWHSTEKGWTRPALDALDTTPRGILMRAQAIENAKRKGLLKFAEEKEEEAVLPDPTPRQGIS